MHIRSFTTLAFGIVLALYAAPDARAQSASPDADATDLGQVVVTGSRIKRAEVEGVEPVVVISAQQIQQEGFLTVYDVLKTLNQQGSVEADTKYGSHTPNAAPINLRDLGPGRTLLLVNGHRVADYPQPYAGESNFANFANIPSAAVERIEILTGGASAIYGSDAVAGVINVILKKGYTGNQLRVRGGTATEGGRDVFDLSWVGGHGGDKWNLTYALQWTRRDPLSVGERPKMDSQNDESYSNWTAQARKYGFNPFTGLSLIDADSNQRLAPPSGTCARFGGQFIDAQRLSYDYNSDTVRNRGRYCGMAHDYADWLAAKGGDNGSAYLYGTFDFDNGVQAWSTLSTTKSRGYWTYDPPYVYLGPFHDTDSDRNLYAIRQLTRYESGGWKNLANITKEFSWDLSAGLKGRLADRFDWEVAIGRARYTVDEYVRTVDTQKATDYFLGPQLGSTADGTPIYALNEDRWYQPLTGAQYNALAVKADNRADSWVNQASANITGELIQGWAGPIKFAAVGEVAKQGYRLVPDPCANNCYPLDVVDHGGGERLRYSGGIEFNVPLLSSLNASLAARHDRYGDYRSYSSDLGTAIGTQSDTTWSAGLEWRPLSTLLLRGSVATSFRAPDMQYVLGEPSSTQQTVIDQYRCIQKGYYLTGACNAENSDVYYLMQVNRRGTPDLESEHGRSVTTGFVWDITEGLSLTTDYYKIRLQDMIKDLNRDEVLSAEAGCRTGLTTAGGVWVNPGGAEYCTRIVSRVSRDAAGRVTGIEQGPINIAQMRVSGIDAALKYRLTTARWGNFNFALDYNNLIGYHEQTYRTDDDKNLRDQKVRTKLRGSVHWENGGPLDLTVYAKRFGSTEAVNWGTCTRFDDGYQPSPSAECRVTDRGNRHFGESTIRYFGRVGPALYWNLTAGYRITPKMKVNLYVNNVFNTVGYDNKERYYGYQFYNTTLYDAVGREVAAEYVFDF
ncbi:TonB-dependent receptor plug domain-containing protein [Xanthomonas albilineans]|uniref:TonB-dependent receptor plug domain-containing protein n=1 Tax=Xanthomonas albilineans TaxID=29447 RepID=UPI0005F33EFD|nr:TonB-dependent receptor [Xanthomonas albilineans]